MSSGSGTPGPRGCAARSLPALWLAGSLAIALGGCAASPDACPFGAVPLLCRRSAPPEAMLPIPGARAPEPAPPEPPPLADRLVLRGVYFDPGSDQIDPASAVVLDVAADQLRQRAGLRVAIEGHTDSAGDARANQSLSLRRAESVRRYLVRKGVPAERLAARGRGESSPVAPNDTQEGRARNRRVDFEISQ